MAPKQTPPRRTTPSRTAPNQAKPNRTAPSRRKPQPTDWQQDDQELPEAPFTGLVVEEINVEAERKPQRKAARPLGSPAPAIAPARHAVRPPAASQRPDAARPADPSPSKPGRAAKPKAAVLPVASLDVVTPAEESLLHLTPTLPASLSEASSKSENQNQNRSEHPPAHSREDEEEIAEIPAEDEQAGERLQKLLARAGVASRRRAEELIAEGRVQVNGQVVTEPGSRALLGRDHVRVDGKLVQAAERMRYLVLNKPKGYVTTVSDPEGRPTVMDFFKGVRERVYPVGRLDYLSEGLLLVTNDGPLANGLTRAAHGVEKRYLVKVAGDPDESTLDTLRTGVVIERGRPGSGEGRVRTSPAQIRKVRQGDNPWFEVVLIEGRNRELRKMFEEIGHHVEKIRRVGYGPLELDQEPGKVRELDEEELRLLRLAAEGKWKPKRRREPIALPKEAGRSVRHERGGRDGRGFTGKPSPSSAPRLGDRKAGSAAPRPAWKERGRFDDERGSGQTMRRDESRQDRPQRSTTGERNSRERGAGGRSAGSDRNSGFKRSGFQREGGFARPSRPSGSGRPTGSGRPGGQFRPDGPSRSRPSAQASDRTASDRTGAERSFGKPGAARTGFSKPGFAKSGSSRPGRPAFGRSGPARPGSGKWRQEEEKPQPGGRNSTQKMGPDGKPREKKRWRDSFEGKSKGKPKWSGKQPGKPKSE